jgi:hypothetical protein
MTRAEIDSHIDRQWKLGRKSYLAANCKTGWDLGNQVCLAVNLKIEKANLYYVNKIIDYTQLQSIYRQAEKELAGIPDFDKSFKEDLRDAGKILVGAVTGFLKSGPVGVFTGSATASQKIITEARQKKIAAAHGFIQSQNLTTEQASQIREAATQKAKMVHAGVLGLGLVIVGGIVWWMASD